MQLSAPTSPSPGARGRAAALFSERRPGGGEADGATTGATGGPGHDQAAGCRRWADRHARHGPGSAARGRPRTARAAGLPARAGLSANATAPSLTPSSRGTAEGRALPAPAIRCLPPVCRSTRSGAPARAEPHLGRGTLMAWSWPRQAASVPVATRPAARAARPWPVDRVTRAGHRKTVTGAELQAAR